MIGQMILNSAIDYNISQIIMTKCYSRYLKLEISRKIIVL